MGSDGAERVGDGVPLKVYVVRRARPSVHRLRGVGSLEELRGVLREVGRWGAGRDFAVQYDDGDGDRITIATEREWAEAVRLHAEAVERGAAARDAPLRLYAVRVRGAWRGRPRERLCNAPSDGGGAGCHWSDDDAGSCGGSAEGEERGPVEPPPPPPPTPDPSEASATPPRAYSECGEDPPAPAPSDAEDDGARHFSCEMDERMLALLSALYGCDMGEELLRAVPGADFGCALRRTCDDETGRVEVEVCLGELSGAVRVAAAALLDRLEARRAADLLELACTVLPEDAGLRYSAGCALAMCGRRECAMAALAAAVRLGYCDAERLERDVELASVRCEAGFGSLVRAARAAGEACAAPSPNVQQLLAVFPALGRAGAEAVLARNGGCVRAAAAELLDGAC